jgi:hypothetical protein
MATRAGITRKVSLSVNKDDLTMLKARAKRLHGGNVSAVFGDLIARIRREEALERAFEWYGEPIVLDDEARARIDREIFGTSRSPGKQRPPRKRRR